MKSWTSSDSEKIAEIRSALFKLESEYGISFIEEIKWLNNLKYRE